MSVCLGQTRRIKTFRKLQYEPRKAVRMLPPKDLVSTSGAETEAGFPYELLFHSETGADHLSGDLRGNGNQDCFGRRFTPRGVILAVTDGCGSTPDASTGARAAIRLILNICDELLNASEVLAPEQFGRELQTKLLSKIRALAIPLAKSESDEDLAAVLYASYLFTLLVAVITPRWAAIFAAGDGFFMVNGEVRELKPGTHNEPDYIVYRMFPGEGTPDSVSVVFFGDTEQVKSLLVGTDGLLPVFRRSRMTSHGEFRLSCLWEDPGRWNRQVISEVFSELAAERHELEAATDGRDGMRMTVRIRDRSAVLTDDCTFVLAVRRDQTLPEQWLAMRAAEDWSPPAAQFLDPASGIPSAVPFVPTAAPLTPQDNTCDGELKVALGWRDRLRQWFPWQSG